jgi:hypothetical protein
MARENRTWGYDRIVGALANLGYTISDQTVGNILKHHGIPPAPERKKTMTWREFIRIHMDVLGATDFFTSEVWMRCALVIAYLFCFIHVGRHPRRRRAYAAASSCAMEGVPLAVVSRSACCCAALCTLG